jgi:hypothetical protein
VLKKILAPSFPIPHLGQWLEGVIAYSLILHDLLCEWDCESDKSSLSDVDGSDSDWTGEEESSAGSILSDNESENFSNNCNIPLSSALPSNSSVRWFVCLGLPHDVMVFYLVAL